MREPTKPTRGRGMTTSCLVNNYNYARFVVEAIESALNQTVPFDEIIVVDDGSTDGSAELLARKYSGQPRVKIIAKRNEGQLSCFNEGFARSHGQIVFFLDADDVFERDYVSRALDVYRSQPQVNCVFCGLRQFGLSERVQLDFGEDRDLGYSAVLTAIKRRWIGAPTSCLSMRRGVLEKILPLPFLDSWRVEADDCLVFGASLAGARKYYLAQPLVRYRVHTNNNYHERETDKFADYRRRLAINILFEHFQRKLCYDPKSFAEFAHREFCTIARPSFRQFMQYLRLVADSGLLLRRRLSQVAAMARYLVSTRRSPAAVISTATFPALPSAIETLQEEPASLPFVRRSASESWAQQKAAA